MGFQSSSTFLQSFFNSTPKALVLVCQKRISTEVDEPLKLALTVGCEFPIRTKLHVFPSLLVCWSTPGAQTIHRPLGLAHPSPPFQLSRSRCGRNVLWLLSTHTTRFPSQGKKHWGETWLLLKSQLGREDGYSGRWMCAAAPGSWKTSHGLTVQYMQGNFVQSAWCGVHTKLKGKCQFLLLLARIKTISELIFLKQDYKKKIIECINSLLEILDLLALDVSFQALPQS